MKTILVVDDDNMNLATMKRVLGKEYKVVLVKKGVQAISYLENGTCDMILLDINMPEMDGFEVMKRIRTMEPCSNIPVIFLTGDNDSEMESRCFKEGAIDFIAKPFVPAVMLSRIGRALELEDLRRSLADQLEQIWEPARRFGDRSKGHRMSVEREPFEHLGVISLDLRHRNGTEAHLPGPVEERENFIV